MTYIKNMIDERELQCFKDLFLEYYTVLCTYICRYVENTVDSEDIAQDVFFDLWKQRKKIDFSTSVKPLLYKLAKNKSIDYLRSARHKEESLDYAEPGSFLHDYVKNMIINQEDDFYAKQLSTEIQTSIDALPTQCKKIFSLSRFDGLKNREIAEQLNISAKAVEKHITKALFEIRTHLHRKEMITLLFALSSF